MISTNEKFSYKVNFVKFPQDRYTSFSIGVKIKDSNSYENYQIFCFKKHESLQNGDTVRIKEIFSTEAVIYNNKKQLKVTCDIEIIGKANDPNVYQAPKQEYVQQTAPASNQPTKSIDITDDDLPF